MEENKYNDLDKLFRSRLKEDGIHPEEWNTPSDDVFHNALSIIDERRRKFPFLWILLALLILILGGVITWQYVTLSTLKTEIANLEKTQDQILETQKERTEQPTLGNNNSTPKRAGVDNIEVQGSDPETSVDNSTALTPNAQAVSSEEEEAPTVDPDNVRMVPFKQLDKAEVEQTALYRSGTPVSSLPTSQINEFLLSTNVAIDPPLIITETILEDQHFWSPYMLWSSELSTFTMSNLPDAGFSLTDYDKYYRGMALGAGVKQQINSLWSIDYALTYHKQYNQSHYKDRMPYDKQKEEKLPGGSRSYSTDISIVSPTGQLRENVEMTFQNKDIPDQAEIKNHTIIDQDLSTIGLSIVPRYHLVRALKFDASIGLGLKAHYILNFDEKMAMALYHEGEPIKSETFRQASPPMLNEFFGGLYGNVDFRYHISDHFSLGLQTGYYRSLTSLKAYKSEDKARTYMHTLNLNFWVAYRM